MRQLLITLGFLLGYATVIAQYCTPDQRFTEVIYFSEEEIALTPDVVYGIAENWRGEMDSLRLDVFAPTAVRDSLGRRPAIIIIHGGGFQNGDKSDWHGECRAFAQRGFVAFSISYRLGWQRPREQVEAAYRATQDARAALRHIVHYAEDYGVDRDWLFLGGGSAGAVTALNTVYTTQVEWNSLIPGLGTELGLLEASGNNLTDTYRIRGIFNNWGAAVSPFVQSEEMVPMISFHGEEDTTVPIDEGNNGALGSRGLHEVLTANNVCSELVVKPAAGHGIYRSPSGTDFRAARASCFFKSLFCDTCVDFSTTDSIPANCANVVATSGPLSESPPRVYPNPFHDQFTIAGGDGPVHFVLYNLNGQILTQGYGRRSPSLLGLPAGLYLLHLNYGDRHQIFKLFKQ